LFRKVKGYAAVWLVTKHFKTIYLSTSKHNIQIYCCLLLYDGGHKSLFRWTLQMFCIQLKYTWIQMH